MRQPIQYESANEPGGALRKHIRYYTYNRVKLKRLTSINYRIQSLNAV
ncbi:IS3 family transposase [Neisseria musculi]|nr:hypothetical protein [Neisseria sp. 19428wB4_WF04]